MHIVNNIVLYILKKCKKVGFTLCVLYHNKTGRKKKQGYQPPDCCPMVPSKVFQKVLLHEKGESKNRSTGSIPNLIDPNVTFHTHLVKECKIQIFQKRLLHILFT